MHNASRVLLGSVQSSFKVVDNRVGTIAAGTIVRLANTGAISVASSAGLPLGISLGRDLSDTDKTAICRIGLGVPVLLTASFTPVIGAQVHISDTTGLAIAAGAGATGMNAEYVSGVLTGETEAGGTANVAYIDMPGGL